jgi:S-formylglutathione hydrolase FrmB
VLKWIYGVELASGPVPALAFGVGAAALAYLLIRRSPKWWIYAAATAVASAAAAMALCWAVINVWYWWPEDLPNTVVVCVAFGIWGLITALLGVGRAVRHARTARHGTAEAVRGISPVRRVLGVTAAVAILSVSALQVNAYFGEYPTVGSLVQGAPALALGIPHYLTKKDANRFRTVPVADGWTAPRAMPATGEFRSVAIPGKVSGFHARDAVVYLPPAYFTAHRPVLPVLVMVSGQPGSPDNYLQSGRLEQALGSYASDHHGLAPVVVIPDANGSQEANTMCMNSALGRVDTYMAVDVPDWITDTLNVDTNHRHWAVAGFSYGATCAVQMVTRHPNVYSTFAAISPEHEPALTANRTVTIQRAFDGRAAAFDAVVPLTLLEHRKYPEIHGWFASGEQDAVYTKNVGMLFTAGRKAGMTLTRTTFPGGHSWIMVGEALPSALNFLGARLGLQ